MHDSSAATAAARASLRSGAGASSLPPAGPAILEPLTDARYLTPPEWMGAVLRAAGLYNLLWGLSVIIAPSWLFHLLGMEQPLYPQIWQALGMVIGVYGIGYWIAASNAYAHWPIVLVGLLGKVFGPVGYIFSVFASPHGAVPFPPAFGWMLIPNDLIWIVPFAAILWGAARANQPGMSPLAVVQDPWESIRSQHGHTLGEVSRRAPTLVVFLRHSGCTFCREALQDLQALKSKIAATGSQLAIVHLDHDAAGALAWVQRYDIGMVEVFADPDRQLYRAFRLELGSLWQLFSPRVFWRGFRAAILDGHGVGRLQGNGFQMPGAFLVHNQHVLREYRHRDASDRPDYAELACVISPATDTTPADQPSATRVGDKLPASTARVPSA